VLPRVWAAAAAPPGSNRRAPKEAEPPGRLKSSRALHFGRGCVLPGRPAFRLHLYLALGVSSLTRQTGTCVIPTRTTEVQVPMMPRTGGDPRLSGLAPELMPLDEEVTELSLLLPGWQVAALEAEARSQGLTTGQMIRQLIRDFFLGTR